MVVPVVVHTLLCNELTLLWSTVPTLQTNVL